MIVNRCVSTFFGVHCDGRAGHARHHWSDTPVDYRSYSVVWTDDAADETSTSKEPHK